MRSEICQISCAARRLSILLLLWREFRQRAVEDTAAEAKREAMFQEVEKCRRNRAEKFAPVCGIRRRQVKVRESNAGSQPP